MQDKLIGATIADRYSITGEIGVGGMGRIYSAISFDDPSELVAIKVILRNGNLTYQNLLRFQKEAAYMSQLFHPNIISFHEMGILSGDLTTSILQDGYYIVMELAYGRSLKSLVSDEKQDLGVFFDISLQLASALEYMHSKGIIHQDIKPSNILMMDSQEGAAVDWHVKLLDFGISRFVDNHDSVNEQESRYNIAGTPLYMAPEATGLVSGKVDHRADLYSLGCVMYEMMTGSPPFEGENKDELAEAHAYQTYKPLAEKRHDIPSYVVSIIDKLLAKNPNDRYQSAFALQVDLQNVSRWLKEGAVHNQSSFRLACYDHVRLNSGQINLVGRKNELDQLKESYELLKKGRGRSRFTLIHGEAGTGKSRLATAFKNCLQSQQSRCVFVRFSMQENSLPFNALANGFNSFLEDLAMNRPTEADEVSRKIAAVLGPSVKTLLPIFQALERYVDTSVQPDYQPMLRDHSSDRIDYQEFNKLFADLTRCLSMGEDPLVVILDDLHLADGHTMTMMDQFFTSSNSHRIQVVMTTRTPSLKQEKLSRILDKLRQLRRRYNEINIGNLDEDSIHLMVRSLLSTKQSFSDDFVRYLVNHTDGNPLVLSETVKMLVVNNLLVYEPEELMWNYDLSAIKRNKTDLPSVDLTLLRIQSYDSIDRLVLEVAALVGNSFGFEMLLIDNNLQAISVMRALNRAISDSLISVSSNSNHDPRFGKSFTFVHKKIREDIRDSVDLEKKISLHRKIATRLESLCPDEPTTQIIFRLAHHYTLSVLQLPDEISDIERNFLGKAIRYNANAGHRAFKLDALLSSERYFSSALSMSRLLDSKTSPESLEIMSALGDVYSRKRDYQNALILYRSYLKNGPEVSGYNWVFYKFANTLMQAGYSSAVLQQVKKFCDSIGYKVSNWPYTALFGIGLRVLETLIFRRHSYTLRSLKLDRRHLVSSNQIDGEPEGFNVSYFFRLAQFLAMGRSREHLIRYHWELIKALGFNRKYNSSTAYFAGEHAVLLAYLGFTKSAQFVIENAIEEISSHDDKESLSYLSVLKAIIIDQLLGEQSQEDLSALTRNLGVSANYFLKVHANVFEIVSALLACERSVIRYQIKHFASLVRTRHWMSPRGLAVYNFGLLLQGQRNNIIQYMEYMKRRRQIGARKNGLFICALEAIVSLAAGNSFTAKKKFKKALYYFLSDKSELLLPHESDFLSLFVVLFPILLENDFDLSSHSEDDIQSYYKALLIDRKHRLNKKRAVSQLVIARIHDISGDQKAPLLYSDAQNMASEAGQSLVVILARLWKAQFLFNQGDENQCDELENIILDAQANRLDLVADLAKRSLERVNRHKRASGEIPSSDELQQFPYHYTTLYDNYIQFVHGFFESEMNSSLAFDHTIRILSSKFSFSSVSMVVMADAADVKPVLFRSHEMQKANGELILKSIQVYEGLSSILIIPATDEDDDQFLTTSLTAQRSNQGQSSKKPDSLPNIGFSEEADNTRLAKISSGLFDVYIPILYGEVHIGVMWIRRVLLNPDQVKQSNFEFEKLGALVAIWARYKQSISQFQRYPHLKHIPGSAQLESVEWLDFWTSGALPRENEMIWYLGLNISSDRYFVVYVNLVGAPHLRERLSQAIWYHCLVMRSLGFKGNRRERPHHDLFESFKSLICSIDEVERLEDISLSFTVFSRLDGSTESGHFGRARPIVLGAENRISAQNFVVTNLKNNKAVRFWTVTCQQAKDGLYLLCDESAMLERLPISNLLQDEFIHSSGESKHKVFKEYLRDNLASIHVPRFYIAGILRSEVKHSKEEIA